MLGTCTSVAQGLISRQGVQPRSLASLPGVTSSALARLNKLVRGLQLMPETLFLTMNLIDRFLEARSMTRKNLQLVGAWCTQWLHLPAWSLKVWWRGNPKEREILQSLLALQHYVLAAQLAGPSWAFWLKCTSLVCLSSGN